MHVYGVDNIYKVPEYLAQHESPVMTRDNEAHRSDQLRRVRISFKFIEVMLRLQGSIKKSGKRAKESFLKSMMNGLIRLMKATLIELDILRDPNAPVFSQKMASVYLFGRPDIYFKTIDYLIMLISFYMALWVCNFVVSTNVFPPIEKEAWKVYSLLPGLISFSMYSYVIRASAFLRVRILAYFIVANMFRR